MDKTTEFKRLIAKVASETNTTLPQGYQYRYTPYNCWKCGKEIIIFKWTDSLLAGEISEPPAPIPTTLKQRHTAMSDETYWANVCPSCDSVQGDFFINHEPDSPFFGLGEIVDNEKSFNEDIERIADYYYGQIVSWPTQN